MRLTFASQARKPDIGLGPEAKVGIGLGGCLAVGLIGIGMILLLKRQQNTTDANQSPVPTSLETESILQTHYKPAASLHSSELSIRVSDESKKYHITNVREVQNHAVPSNSPNQAPGRRHLNGITLWAWEIFSLFIGILSLASIILVLAVYEDRQLQEWTPKVSINAVISILSAIFKGSLALPVTEGTSQ